MKRFGIAAAMIIAVLVSKLEACQLQSDSVVPSSSLNDSHADIINGKWTYRSFHSDPNLDATPQSLLYGVWELNLEVDASNQISGTMLTSGWTMDVEGLFEKGDPSKITLKISGKVAGEQWRYLAEGYLTPNWSEGVAQRAAIVGSILRLSEEDDQDSKGYVAQWIGVKQEPVDVGREEDRVNNFANQNWSLTTVDGDEITPDLLSNQKSVMVFSQGFTCLHCAQQIRRLIELQEEFTQRDTKVFVFVADSNRALTRAIGETKTNVHFISDVEQAVFEVFGCADSPPQHGMFVIGDSGICHWQQRGDQPWMGFEAIFECLDQLAK